MKGNERLYAVIGGCVGAFITMLMCSFDPLGAQSREDGNFGVLNCRELQVLDSEGNHHIWISSNEDGGSIGVYGAPGAVLMTINEEGGWITVAGHEGGAWMTLEVYGGIVSVFSNDRKEGVGAILGIAKDGGEVTVLSGKETKATMGVDEYGNGVVATWDKDYSRTAELK